MVFNATFISISVLNIKLYFCSRSSSLSVTNGCHLVFVLLLRLKKTGYGCNLIWKTISIDPVKNVNEQSLVFSLQ
jgi:hypothetical protein